MKYIALLTIILLSGFNISAQDKNAEKLLKTLAEKHNAYENITADFTFHYKSLQSESENTWSGSVIMEGEKYKLELRNSTIYYNGTTLWNYLQGPNEVNISEPVQNEDSDIINHPHQIFDIYKKKNFKYKFLGKESMNGQEVYVIDLYPKTLDKDYSRIRLYLTQEAIQIHSAKIFAKDGSRYTIEIKNMKTNQSVHDSTFVFNTEAHPDAEVIDMRF
ncbi:MAG: outer membrane lipoprotein carrier protein LolA [Bacteroidales bacterium]|nr:outer membrane lipoprotein carrier protein LolA [Bacteroidales bacterium]